ncbi:MAG: ribonuclease P [Nitrososphaerota archaeon]|nr:ribonuclease P [Aigarchaeota archaeon]MDW8076732.1 ribonuclease P [Nitrososphaerota archaeon]
MKNRLLKAIARERVERLFEFARIYAQSDPEAAREAVTIARRIAQRARMRIPKKHKLMFCRKCGNLFLGSGSFSVRIRNRRSTHVVVRCLKCGWIRRYPALKEKHIRSTSQKL